MLASLFLSNKEKRRGSIPALDPAVPAYRALALDRSRLARLEDKKIRRLINASMGSRHRRWDAGIAAAMKNAPPAKAAPQTTIPKALLSRDCSHPYHSSRKMRSGACYW